MRRGPRRRRRLILLAAVCAGALAAALADRGMATEADAPLSPAVAVQPAPGPDTDAQPAGPAADPPAKAPGAEPPPDLGTSFFQRLMAYYGWEMGRAGPPEDPNAPPPRREGWPATPMTTPPYPFTEWPYGGTTLLGVNRPNSVDSPLMTALAPSGLGQGLAAAHIQVYGWINAGGNVSSSRVSGGNAPAAYDYVPNTVQLDQAVVYVERTPDTVQTDHIDWGFRLSFIYGVDYRYTTAYGLWSWQLLNRNAKTGYDAPMVYGEIFIPQVAHGLMIRIGRYIAAPDIEAQLAPNNYMYSHSLGYSFDNFTNTGILATLAVTPNLFLQLGVNAGTETVLWHLGERVTNPFPNPLFPDSTFRKDPGAQPSVTGCLRYQTRSGWNALYLCANGINNGTWGYNNLQWYGFTFYHRFTEKWHVALEVYSLHQDHVPNLNNPQVPIIIANGGTPFSPQFLPFNAPNAARCNDRESLSCTATADAVLAYWNYHFLPLDNLSIRTEYYNDAQGQRTGVKTRYMEIGIGVQHWLSPQVEFRPEVTYYKAFDAPAFNGNSNLGIAPNKMAETVAAGDFILHF